MRYFFDLVIHYLTANSRHGTHSPFVYKLADTIIYRKSNDLYDVSDSTKEAKLINKISTYFNAQCDLKVSTLDITTAHVEDVIDLNSKCPVVILKNIYTSSQNKRKWKTVFLNPQVTVSIDLFYFGIIIWRKEQPKEHFKLRFPYNSF